MMSMNWSPWIIYLIMIPTVSIPVGIYYLLSKLPSTSSNILSEWLSYFLQFMYWKDITYLYLLFIYHQGTTNKIIKE